MPKVIYLQSDGERTELDVASGTSLMLAATGHGVSGVVGDCGGVMSCATCHVVVEDAFAAQLPPPSETESQMLDYTAMPREPHSRLACQIVMTDALDGICVRIADPQL
ncbi:MAG: 2Fe-2S iron-sulfur cluster-binding protein [Hydrogenophaga sp.]|uniref:2Fe-2S iron-sulfur cluster-binding protein n=1 Tax=Hydrogenophaga sp. TaxID=1904254 RepID=UPI003D127D06